MNQNKEAARVLEHPNGKRREIAQPRVSIVHHRAAISSGRPQSWR